VSAFLAAGQTYLLQRNAESIREVYSWLLGRLATGGWHDVTLMLPYAAVTGLVVLLHRRELDVLSVGDDEAASLGLHPQRSRYVLIAAASLGTAAAVSVSGLIGFVGIIVPHAVRLLVGTSYRAILPLSALFGGAFLALTDVVARTAAAPAEIPIGVVTAMIGAPFFVVVLRTTRRVAT
jgi:iron complex transport system permease protein